MKKYLFTLLAVCLVLPVWATAYAQDYGGGYSKEQIMKMVGEALSQPQEKESEVFRCPTSQISDQSKCLTCHVAPSFKVRESDPDDLMKYPNHNTKIRTIDGEKKGFLFIEDINDRYAEEAFDYFKKHGIEHIVIEIHSPGGSLFGAARIVGLMRYYQSQGIIVETRTHGFAASAGFYILANGSKGHRYVNSHSELMWHEVISFSMFSVESPSDKEEAARVLRHLQDTTNTRLSEVSNMTKEEVDIKIRKREFWMTGTEAIEFGFADGFLN
jgi:ATP-dependent protease ClpP protease subunit